jgi:hypothetical protein
MWQRGQQAEQITLLAKQMQLQYIIGGGDGQTSIEFVKSLFNQARELLEPIDEEKHQPVEIPPEYMEFYRPKSVYGAFDEEYEYAG